MKALVLGITVILTACAEPPHVGITISNSPEPIESCGKKIGSC